MTKKYAEKPVANWSTNDFIAYLSDRHFEVYGTEYLPPGRNWQVERGLIGTLIGTRGKNPKPRKYEPELLKRFIDECFKIHRCSPQYPTVSFMWLFKWKTDIWARVVAEEQTKQRQVEAVESVGMSSEELDGWL